MPQTKFQDVIFTIIMVFAMVYAMVNYNIALDLGGLHNAVFAMALAELPIMVPIAFVLEFAVVGKAAKALAFRMVKPGRDPLILVILAISAMTVCLMCPCMSFFATLLFKDAGSEFFAVWVQTTALNFPMALCWQIFFAGPAVRFVFRLLFRRQLGQNSVAVADERSEKQAA